MVIFPFGMGTGIVLGASRSRMDGWIMGNTVRKHKKVIIITMGLGFDFYFLFLFSFFFLFFFFCLALPLFLL